MLIDIQTRDDGIVVLNLSGDILRSNALKDLENACNNMMAQGRQAIVLNLARMRRITLSGLAALIELVARQRSMEISLCALPENVKRKLTNSGLDRGLVVFDTLDSALAAPQFRQFSLSNTKAVVLCAGQGTRVAPISTMTPKPMLDILGRPVLQHILDHLNSFGIRDVALNPGHLGAQIIDHIRSSPLPGQSVLFANEGHMQNGQWQANPIGSASTLQQMQRRNAAFSDNFIVLCGDALIDLDLAAMMRQHIQSGADVTIAAQTVAEADTHKYGIIVADDGGRITSFEEKPLPGTASSTLANTGIYIFKPQVLDLLPDAPGLDIACDLLPSVQASGGRMHVFAPEFSWTDIGSIPDYVSALRQALKADLPNIRPVGKEVRPGVWCAQGSWVSPRADISGPCYVGPNSIVDAGAKLTGTTVIGRNALIDGKTLLSNSIVMDQTHVQSGAWAQNMVLHSDWSVDHSQTFSASAVLEPIDRISPVMVDNILLQHRLA